MSIAARIILYASLMSVALPAFSRPHEGVEFIYVNFSIETYSPVTRANIERNSACYFAGAPRDLVDEAYNLLSTSNPGEFDDSKVRLKLIGLEERPIYVDMYGGVSLESTGNSRKLSEAAFSRLRALLAPLDELSCGRGPRSWQALPGSET